MKLPEGYSLGFLFNITTGKGLDVYGKFEKLSRKKWLLFKEPDFFYKKRLVKHAITKLVTK